MTKIFVYWHVHIDKKIKCHATHKINMAQTKINMITNEITLLIFKTSQRQFTVPHHHS